MAIPDGDSATTVVRVVETPTLYFVEEGAGPRSGGYGVYIFTKKWKLELAYGEGA